MAEAPTASDATVSGGAAGDDAYFNSGLAVVLAALLCTLIIVLGLNSMVRFAIRCYRLRFTSGRSSSNSSSAGASAPAGNKKQALGGIPVVVYRPGTSAWGFAATDCPICLGEFAKGEEVRVLPDCGHGFHVGCIDQWLGLQSSCPTCRRPVAIVGGPWSEEEEVAGGTVVVSDGNAVVVEVR